MNRSLLSSCLPSASVFVGLEGCASDNPAPESSAARDLAVESRNQALHFKSQSTGQKLFEEAFAGTNGRSCATCHVIAESTTLLPASVEARLATDPTEPLFNRIDADDPLDVNPALDEDGAPIVGPNFVPQLFSTDPGRAAITGNPLDFEAFDMPQLRGIAQTAPYFHDNSHATLKDVVDSYSRFILGAFPPLNLPTVHPPEAPELPPESLTPAQKADLIAFLQRL